MYQEKCEVRIYRFRDGKLLNAQAISFKALEEGFLNQLVEDWYYMCNKEWLNIQVKIMQNDCFDFADQQIAVEVP